MDLSTTLRVGISLTVANYKTQNIPWHIKIPHIYVIKKVPAY